MGPWQLEPGLLKPEKPEPRLAQKRPVGSCRVFQEIAQLPEGTGQSLHASRAKPVAEDEEFGLHLSLHEVSGLVPIGDVFDNPSYRNTARFSERAAGMRVGA